MIEEKLREIEGLINQELCEYEVLSKLYDDKKQYLINSDFNNLSQTDSNIKKCVENINSLEEKRKSADENMGINNTNMSSYIEIAEKNKLSVKQSFCFQKERLAEMNHIIANKEKTNIELIKQGLCTVNKLINIIVNSATKSNQYNNNGKNTQDEGLNISSIVEEV